MTVSQNGALTQTIVKTVLSHDKNVSVQLVTWNMFCFPVKGLVNSVIQCVFNYTKSIKNKRLISCIYIPKMINSPNKIIVVHCIHPTDYRKLKLFVQQINLFFDFFFFVIKVFIDFSTNFKNTKTKHKN